MKANQFSHHSSVRCFVAKVALLAVLATIGVLFVTPAPAHAWLTYVTMYKDGQNDVDGLDGTYSAVVSPDGKYVYGTGFFDDAVALFSRAEATGELTYVTMYKDGQNGVDGLDGPEHAAISPDGKNLYVGAYFGHALTVFSRDESTGELSFVEYHQDDTDGVDGLSAVAHVTVSADGRNVYVVGESDSAVAVFSRDTTTGELSYLSCFKDGENGVDGLGGAFGIVVSPDNRHVYVSSHDDNAVAVFSRDTSTGELTYVTCYKDGQNGVDGLYYCTKVAVTPDGKHVYATGGTDKAVAVFSRDSITGELTYVTCYKDGQGGVDGLNGAYGLVVSPDGQKLFVTGLDDSALAVFSRDTTTGELTYVTCYKDGQSGVDGLDCALNLAVSPDYRHVYVAGNMDNALSFFRALSHTLTVGGSGSGSGTVTDNLGCINCGENCTHDYAEDAKLTLTAVPDSGSLFAGWSGDCSGQGNPCVLDMDQDRNATANFKANSGAATMLLLLLSDE